MLTILPIDWPDKLARARNKGEALDRIISPETYGILSLEAYAGDRYSTEILFRLLEVTDGYSTTLIKATLGAIVRINPKLFLSSLSEYKDKPFIKKVGYAVAGPDYSYNNHPSAFRYDLEKRIESLETITDCKYADVKAACIKKIREELGRLGQDR